MPELPDLEVFARNLDKRFKNKRLRELKVMVAKKLNVTVTELKAAIQGQELKQVLREGKTLQLHFENGAVLGLHLMLHGELQLLEPGQQVKHQIISLRFSSGDGFVLTDFQKAATPTLNPKASDVPDALAKEMNLDYFSSLLSKRRTPIKTVLMDQKSLRGIGNTYADEILWQAGISPFSIAKAIPDVKVKALHKAIEVVLNKEVLQIEKQLDGAIFGEIHDFLKIHRADLISSPGGAEIKVKAIGGRKAYFTDEQQLYE